MKDDHTHLVVAFKSEMILDKMRQRSFPFEPLQTVFSTWIPILILENILVLQSSACQDVHPGSLFHQADQRPKLTGIFI